MDPLRTAFQPPPALPVDGKTPPAPNGKSKKSNANSVPGDDVPYVTSPVHESPQLLEVNEVFADEGYACGAGGCDDWCYRKHWCRSTCDMPPHYAYPPESHGYYYFRPYNYRHVLFAQQIAPLLGADPIAPYETEMFQKFYADVPDIDLGNKGDDTLKSITPEIEELPNLEDLLGPPKKKEQAGTKKDESAPVEAKRPSKTPSTKKNGKKNPAGK